MRCSPRRSPLLAPVAHGCSDRHLQYVEISVVLCGVIWCVVLCVVWCGVLWRGVLCVVCGVVW
jgi:hypothetical protein